jgi:hypothetical protein
MTLFIGVPVPNQESERSCICVSGELILPLATFVLLEVETVFYLLTTSAKLVSKFKIHFSVKLIKYE